MNVQKQAGFTLIELVMVIVILGILAAAAIPQFVDLSGEANQGAVNGIAGALSSAAAVNYATCKTVGTSDARCKVVNNCTDAANTLQSALPTGYTITAAAVADNATVSCTITHTTSTKTATFSAIGT